MTKQKEENPIKALAKELSGGVKNNQEFNTILSDLFEHGIETVLKAALDEHFGHHRHEESLDSNYRNGANKKTVKSSLGDVALNIPRVRNSSFIPMFVPKHERMIDGIEDVVFGLYARGMNTRDIEDQIRDIYKIDISETKVSNITSRNRIHETVAEWAVGIGLFYTVWMDAISINVRENGRVNNKSDYLTVGLNEEGKRSSWACGSILPRAHPFG